MKQTSALSNSWVALPPFKTSFVQSDYRLDLCTLNVDYSSLPLKVRQIVFSLLPNELMWTCFSPQFRLLRCRVLEIYLLFVVEVLLKKTFFFFAAKVIFQRCLHAQDKAKMFRSLQELVCNIPAECLNAPFGSSAVPNNSDNFSSLYRPDLMSRSEASDSF